MSFLTISLVNINCEYSYVDSEYMSDEDMLMQEFPDNPTYSQTGVNSMIKKALKKVVMAKLYLEEAEEEFEGEFDDQVDEDDFDDELDEDI